VRDNAEYYHRAHGSLERIHFEPVTYFPGRATDYVFKAFGNGRVSYDEGVLILPRALSELS
jgi:hypothetical protein